MQELTLDEYAAVMGAQNEGYSQAEALALEAIDTEVWEAGVAVWEAALEEDADLEGPLAEALEQALDAAGARYGRDIEPLGDDVEAWIRLHRWWLSHPQPPMALARVGLRERDMLRLHRCWSQRMSSDDALRQRILTLYKEPLPTEPPAVVTRPHRVEPRKQRSADGSWTLSRARQTLDELRKSAPPATAAMDDNAEVGFGAEGALVATRSPIVQLEIDQEQSQGLPAGGKPPPLVVALPRDRDEPPAMVQPGASPAAPRDARASSEKLAPLSESMPVVSPAVAFPDVPLDPQPPPAPLRSTEVSPWVPPGMRAFADVEGTQVAPEAPPMGPALPFDPSATPACEASPMWARRTRYPGRRPVRCCPLINLLRRRPLMQMP